MSGERLMIEWESAGKIFIGVGTVIALLGVLFLLVGRVPSLSHLLSWFGRLPGDISVKRDNFSLYFPLATSIVLSIILSLLFYLLSWIFRR
jgi:Protein of unknown function (DUF2905)